MLLTKKNLAVLAATMTEKRADNPFKTVVKLDPDRQTLTAADGRMMLMSDLAGNISHEDYPETDPGTWPDPECSLIPAAALIKAEKNIKKNEIPALECIAVEMNEAADICLTTTDLDTQDVVKAKRPDISYPDTENVIALVDQAARKDQFGLAVDVLEKMVKAAKKHGAEVLKISTYGPTSPVKVEAYDVPGLDGYLMPYSIELDEETPDPIANTLG